METLPFRREPRPIVIDVARCREEVTRALPPDWNAWTATTAELQSALEEARAAYTAGRSTASVLAEAIASLAVVWTDVTAGWMIEGPGADPLQANVAWLVDLWIAERGIPHAMDVLVASYGIVQTLSPTRIEPSTPNASGNVAGPRQPARWRRLREHVAHVDDAAYAEARAHAERLRARGAPGARVITSFAFPWEAEWARADAAGTGRDRLALVGAQLDGKTCAKIIGDAQDGMIFEDGRFATMVEMLGDDALEPLRAVMEMHWLDLSVPTALLARYATPEVAATMVDALDRREAETARDFFRRNPVLALDALVKPTTTSAALARRTKPLLASAVARAHEHALEVVRRTKKNVRAKNLLEELGATETWLGKKKPKRLLEAVAKFPSVAAWIGAGAPWSGREALREIREPTEVVAVVRAAANDALPVAMAAIDALAELPDALKWLGRVEHATIRPEVDEHARCRARELQAARGLADDDVDDLAAPSFANVLDFGARRFFARLDAEMKPALFDATGKRLASLPHAGKHDDAESAARAAEAWTLFRDDAASEASVQAARMEQAMIAGRDFPDEIFRGVVVRHPVLGTLARRLVWRDSSGTFFRVAEDGSFASADDETIDVRAPVRIADPAAMSADARFRWSEVLASYEIVQPFAQLGRT